MFAAQCIPYSQTNAFTKIILDYLTDSEKLESFYEEPSTLAGIEETIRKKQLQPVNRTALVEALRQQYSTIETTKNVKENIDLLLS